MTDDHGSLSDIATLFLQSSGSKAVIGQQDLLRFVRWFSRDQRLELLMPMEVQFYAEQLSLGTPDAEEKLQVVRDFLMFAKQRGFIDQNLARHVRARRSKRSLTKNNRPSLLGSSTTTAFLTAEGYTELKDRLVWLREEATRATFEIRKAAADKDVRENAPLEAAKQYHGQILSRIRDAEATMARAQVITEDALERNSGRAKQGSRIILKDLSDGEELVWVLVDPREANIREGRMSVTSPVGHALLEHSTGDEIEVAAPKGTIRYQLVNVQ